MSGKTNAATIRDNQDVEAHVKTMEIVNSDQLNKSQKIRQLFAITQDRSTVAQLLGIKYQHVRNVLMTKLASDQ